jgi:hypothetical protein
LVGSVICWPPARWCRRCPAAGRGRLHGSRRARRTTVQPVQLSLLPEQDPVPVRQALDHLPETETAEAIGLLAALIAKAAAGEQEPSDD